MKNFITDAKDLEANKFYLVCYPSRKTVAIRTFGSPRERNCGGENRFTHDILMSGTDRLGDIYQFVVFSDRGQKGGAAIEITKEEFEQKLDEEFAKIK